MNINKVKKSVERSTNKNYNLFIEVSERDYLVFEHLENYLYFSVDFIKGHYKIVKTSLDRSLTIRSEVTTIHKDLVATSSYITLSIDNFIKDIK